MLKSGNDRNKAPEKLNLKVIQGGDSMNLFQYD